MQLWRHNKSKMADGRHTENRFLAVSRRHIGRSTRNLEQRWRITCRYRSHDQNCNFRTFKMADVRFRHFENSFISISQRRIIRFRSNLVCRCKFPFWGWLFDKNRNFSNSRWRTDAILKIVFWLYLGAILADQSEIWNRDESSHADIGHMTKTAIFRKFKTADGRHFENRFIFHISAVN